MDFFRFFRLLKIRENLICRLERKFHRGVTINYTIIPIFLLGGIESWKKIKVNSRMVKKKWEEWRVESRRRVVFNCSCAVKKTCHCCFPPEWRNQLSLSLVPRAQYIVKYKCGGKGIRSARVVPVRMLARVAWWIAVSINYSNGTGGVDPTNSLARVGRQRHACRWFSRFPSDLYRDLIWFKIPSFYVIFLMVCSTIFLSFCREKWGGEWFLQNWSIDPRIG